MAQYPPEKRLVTEARLPVLVTEMRLGGGSGVREVAGTVTLTTADPALVEVYATAAATVNGESLAAGDAAVFRRLAGAWDVMVVGKDAVWRRVGTVPLPPDPSDPTPAEPTAVNVTAPVADDAKNTWTWAPVTGARMVIDGVERTGGTYSVGDVTKVSTAKWEALPGYLIGNAAAEGSRTFSFTGAVAAYKAEVMADAPLYLWMLDDPAGTATPKNDGTGTAALTIPADAGASLAQPGSGLGAGTTSLFLESSNNTATFGAITAGAPILARLNGLYTVEAIVRIENPGYPQAGHLYAEGSWQNLLWDPVTRNVTSSVAAPKATDWAVAYKVKSDDGVWVYGQTVHLALVYDQATVRLYINGALVKENSAAPWNNAPRDDGNFSLGRAGAYRGRYYMAGVAIHNKALSGARILAHAKAAGRA